MLDELNVNQTAIEVLMIAKADFDMRSKQIQRNIEQLNKEIDEFRKEENKLIKKTIDIDLAIEKLQGK